jgi:hypothetical protein
MFTQKKYVYHHIIIYYMDIYRYIQIIYIYSIICIYIYTVHIIMIIVCKYLYIYIYVLYIHIIYKYQAKCYDLQLPRSLFERDRNFRRRRRAPFWIS